MSSEPNAMPSPATVEIWTIDKCILVPGTAARELNRLIARETELLEANNRYLERARNAEASAKIQRERAGKWGGLANRTLKINSQYRVELYHANHALKEMEKRGNFSFLEMEAALCVWEWMLDVGAKNVERWREAIGTAEARQTCFAIGRYCLEIYDLGKKMDGPNAWDGLSFDWDVIPAICETILFADDGGHHFHEDNAEVAQFALHKVSNPRDAQPQEAEKFYPVIAVNMSGFERAAAAIKQFGVDLKAFLEPLDIAPLSFRYRNYRGEVSVRTVRPLNIYFGSTEWHPEPQWLLAATDIEKGERRDFAIKDINPPAFTAFELDRLIAAVEGECDGLAIDHKQAEAILKYVIFEHP
ncbi:hypothetical protein PCC82_06540 [Agrobacterium deltaense]